MAAGYTWTRCSACGAIMPLSHGPRGKKEPILPAGVLPPATRALRAMRRIPIRSFPEQSRVRVLRLGDRAAGTRRSFAGVPESGSLPAGEDP